MRYFWLALCCFLVSCASKTEKVAVYLPPPMTPIQIYPSIENSVAKTGSLFDGSDGIDLFANSRASRIGDIVMVKIVENSKGENTVDTKLERSSALSVGVNAFFGKSALGSIPIGAPTFGTSSDRNTEGKAKTSRENTLTATVAVRVINILPGNILQLEGIRSTQVNNEVQYIVIRGLVRARDIEEDNTVLSTKLAESSVSYYGKGDLAEQQKQGWGTRAVNTIWPF
ncbi:MAG: flagellar basal body L-ring protein FlgH [Desulfovibrionaceae bacterium]